VSIVNHLHDSCVYGSARGGIEELLRSWRDRAK
jgi:hypothetical protein